MTEETTTVEVDPDELSERVVEDLVEEGVLEEDAKNYGDKVWFKEVEAPEPTKKEGAYNKVSSRVGSTYKLWRDRSAFIGIESVERTNEDKVRLNFYHPEYSERTATFSLNSSVLGNIMALAGVENPKELENGRLLMTEDTFNNPNLIVPDNLSMYGRTKYKLYSFVTQIREKTRIHTVDEDSAFALMILTLVSWIPAAISPLFFGHSEILAGVFLLPAIIMTSISIATIVYALARAFLFILAFLFRGEVSEIKTKK